MDNINILTKNRIDIVIGIKYCEAYCNNYQTSFFKDLYLNYKYAFNGLLETSGTTNIVYKTKQEFLNRFNVLIEDIKQTHTNTELIPVIKEGDEYWMVDGFHRMSILMYFNYNVNLSINNNPMIPLPSLAHNLPVNLNHYGWYPTNITFFKKRGFSDVECDYTMYSFLKYHTSKFSCIILFPTTACEPQNLLPQNILNKINIIYSKQIKNFTQNFQKNFIEMLYYTETWCVNGGAINKSNACFRKSGVVTIMFIEKQELSELQSLKQEIRNFYQERNSVHIPDTQDENNNLLQLLNKNTIDFYNIVPSLYNNFQNFNNYLNKLIKFCNDHNIDSDYICVEGSSILSSYHIRDCGDMDILIDNKYVKSFENSDFDNHNIYTIKGETNYFCPLHFEDIIHNPENHYFYKGVKFTNLSIIKQCKHNRIVNNLFNSVSVMKDKKDYQNIEKYI